MMNRWANMPLIATHGVPLIVSVVCTFIVQTGDASGLESQFWKATVSLWQGTGYQNQLHRAEFLGMSRNYAHIVETEGSLPYSQNPATS